MIRIKLKERSIFVNYNKAVIQKLLIIKRVVGSNKKRHGIFTALKTRTAFATASYWTTFRKRRNHTRNSGG